MGLMFVTAGLAMACAPGLAAEEPPGGRATAARSSPDAIPEIVFGKALTGQSSYGWTWLAQRFDHDQDGTVTSQEFTLSTSFTRLDRNWDGRLTSQDFDWSESSELARQRETAFALFKTTDADGNGRIDADEWQTAFAKAANGKDYLDDEQLEMLVFLPLAQRHQSLGQMRRSGRKLGYDSEKPAPRPGEIAPDFELRSPDGQNTVRLSEFRDKKPVVLIFGSFT